MPDLSDGQLGATHMWSQTASQSEAQKSRNYSAAAPPLRRRLPAGCETTARSCCNHWSSGTLKSGMEKGKCIQVCDVAAKMAPGDITDTRWSGVGDENWLVLSMGVTDLRLDARYRLPTQFVHLGWNQLAVCTRLHELHSVSLLTLLNHLHITWHAANNFSVRFVLKSLKVIHTLRGSHWLRWVTNENPWVIKNPSINKLHQFVSKFSSSLVRVDPQRVGGACLPERGRCFLAAAGRIASAHSA